MASPDDLEIVSVGALYKGSWDKKYWSSSRGKDRFPYPVGYRAVRAHNGNSYHMEIEEGSKGPLFLIRYMAESWTGQTPDIAWGKFQKTGFSHFKNLHGKRFICTMNGMEFFGFKTPFVQRLLRELVTTSCVMVESSSSSRASHIQVDACPSIRPYPNLLCYLDRPVAKKKRSRKPAKVNQNSVVQDGHKKPRFQDSAKGEQEITGLQGAPPEKLQSSHISNRNSYLPSVNPHVNVVFPIQETDRRPDSCKSKPLSQISEELHVLQQKEHELHNPNIFVHESQDMTGSNLCAPDTFDFLQDNIISSASKVGDTTSCEQNEELTIANIVVSEGLISEPIAEDSDPESADQETAQAMISILLPQAIPFLKKASDKKPKRHNVSDTLFCRSHRSKIDKTSKLDVASGTAVSLSTRTCIGDDENKQVVGPDSIEDFTSNVSIAPDSFNEFHLDVSGSGHIISSSKKTYQAELQKLAIVEEHVAIVHANLPISALETTESIKPSSHDVSTILEENNGEECVKKSISLPCSSTSMMLSTGSEEICGVKGNLFQKEQLSENQEPKSTLCSAEVSNGLMAGTNPTEIGSISKEKHKVYSRKRVWTNQQQRSRYSSSDSKNSCRNTGDDDSISKISRINTPHIFEPHPFLSANGASARRNPMGDGNDYVAVSYQGPEFMKVNNNKFTNVLSNEACLVPQDLRAAHSFENASILPSSIAASKVENCPSYIGEALSIQVSEPPSTKAWYKKNTSEKSIPSVPEFPATSNLKLNRDVKIKNEMEKTVELLGCYFHPSPISSLLLQSVGDEIHICVVSFATEDRVRTLFMYKISAKASSKGFPSAIGHTTAILPIVDDICCGNRTLERSYLHFTPDGEHLLFTGNIKTPYCRKREIDCSCLTCTSACFEENVIRIVQVKTGHVTLVTKLQAVDCVQCVVVCDPNYLVAVIKNGNLIVWAMNSDWRGPTEECAILSNPCISSCILELKKIPKCPHLVVGHNGIGEFTIWDISKRSLVSKFVSPSNVIFEFIPASLFAWHPVHTHSTIEDRIDMILAATKLWLSKGSNNKTLVPAEVEDTAVWLLVSTDLDSDANGGHVSSNPTERPARCWRLALLVRNQVILGSHLEPRVSVASTVSGHGVAGTLDGLVYLWDLATGAKLGSLHDFKGQGVSCISSDDSGNISIASGDGQLLVYCRTAKETCH